MSGSNTGLSFAEQLRQTADSKHQGKVNKDVQNIVGVVITKAERVANDGCYSVDYYDERLGATDLDNAVKRLLQEQGFKVEISEDYHYSEHAGQRMMFVRASWK